MPTLDTLVIIVAIYFGGATICSFVNEAIAGAVQLRGSTLYRGLVNLVNGWRALVDDLYAHPLIYARGETPAYGRGYTFWSFIGAENNWPSYVDPRNFSLAFWQTLQNALAGGSGSRIPNSIATTPEQVLDDLKQRVNAMNPAEPEFGRLKEPLAAMLTEAGDDYEKLLALTDAWFNRQMDRVTGWYRRTAQWILLCFAFLLAFGLNVDSIRIAGFFNAQSALTARLNAEIDEAYRNAQPATASPLKSASALAEALTNQGIPLKVLIDPASRSWAQIPGDLITAIAFAMGAPFWFDLLGKVINVRMAGQKPKKKAPSIAQVK